MSESVEIYSLLVVNLCLRVKNQWSENSDYPPKATKILEGLRIAP